MNETQTHPSCTWWWKNPPSHSSQTSIDQEYCTIGTCPNQLFAWTLAGWEQLRWVIKRLILTCRRRDESSSLLLQVYEPFYNSPQLFPTTKSSCKELIWASPYWEHPMMGKGATSWSTKIILLKPLISIGHWKLKWAPYMNNPNQSDHSIQRHWDSEHLQYKDGMPSL